MEVACVNLLSFLGMLAGIDFDATQHTLVSVVRCITHALWAFPP
jgi:hypothetical protein